MHKVRSGFSLKLMKLKFTAFYLHDTQLHWTLCNPVDRSPPGFSVRGKNTGVVAMLSSGGSSQSSDGTSVSRVSCTGRHVLYQGHCLGTPLLA